MAEKREPPPDGRSGESASNTADERREGAAAQRGAEAPSPGRERRGVQKGIANADKIARTGSTKETVRDTPPAGAWNDTSAD